jgi:hypothetical protein
MVIHSDIYLFKKQFFFERIFLAIERGNAASIRGTFPDSALIICNDADIIIAKKNQLLSRETNYFSKYHDSSFDRER